MLAARKDAQGNVVAFVPQRDRATERAMVDAGYMTLREYIERWGDEPAPLADFDVIDPGGAAPPILASKAHSDIQRRVKRAMAEG